MKTLNCKKDKSCLNVWNVILKKHDMSRMLSYIFMQLSIDNTNKLYQQMTCLNYHLIDNKNMSNILKLVCHRLMCTFYKLLLFGCSLIITIGVPRI